MNTKTNSNMYVEARKRSVDNLQRVYTVVISLAITESLRRLLSQLGGTGKLPDSAAVVAVICLIVTIIPFYHGANRYLDSTYVTGERSAKQGALMLDFIALFGEGLVFFILSLLIENTVLFFTLLAFLFFFDSFWVWLTKLSSSNHVDKGQEYKIWASVNNFSAVILLLLFAKNIFQWNITLSPTIQITITLFTVLGRTISDYATVWNFYYPIPQDETYFMPIPRPAPTPTRKEFHK
jgi:hypothetical protein